MTMQDAVLEDLDELLYITDVDTQQLLYANHAACERFALPQDYKEKGIRLEAQAAGRQHIKRRRICYEGRDAWLSIVPGPAGLWAEERAHRDGAALQLLQECVQLLEQSPDVTLSHILWAVCGKIGKYFGADRVFVLEGAEIQSGCVEWHPNAAEPQRTGHREVLMELLGRWLPIFQAGSYMEIRDMESLREDFPKEYAALTARGIHSMILMPLMENRETLCGVIGVDNPSIDSAQVTPAMSMLSYLIRLVLQREKVLVIMQERKFLDALTGIYNRSAFLRDIADRSLYQGCAAGVVYVDVNGMKEINDTQGHVQGDAWLLKIVRTLQSTLCGCRLYRMGGDEFVAVTLGITSRDFLVQTANLRAQLFAENRHLVAIGCQWQADCTDLHTLVHAADEKMYEDKRQYYHGKGNRSRYRSSTDAMLCLTAAGELQKMIQGGRLIPYYQPKVALGGGRKLLGVEALVRLIGEDGSIIPPGKFIPIFEETRHISEIDFFILDAACKQIEQWRRENLMIAPVSVNFSRYSLLEVDFVNRVIEVWSKYDIQKTDLKLEITESVEEDNHNEFIKVMEGLRAAGFCISIDDFGVRYANLNMFTSCVFDELKIDKCLIDDLITNRRTQEIVRAIHSICRSNSVQLIIEGVETQEQAELLQNMGCDGAQGYFYSRPVSATEFQRWIQTEQYV